jgi:hypothetical protein
MSKVKGRPRGQIKVDPKVKGRRSKVDPEVEGQRSKVDPEVEGQRSKVDLEVEGQRSTTRSNQGRPQGQIKVNPEVKSRSTPRSDHSSLTSSGRGLHLEAVEQRQYAAALSSAPSWTGVQAPHVVPLLLPFDKLLVGRHECRVLPRDVSRCDDLNLVRVSTSACDPLASSSACLAALPCLVVVVLSVVTCARLSANTLVGPTWTIASPAPIDRAVCCPGCCCWIRPRFRRVESCIAGLGVRRRRGNGEDVKEAPRTQQQLEGG